MSEVEIALWMIQFGFTVVGIFTSAILILYVFMEKSKSLQWLRVDASVFIFVLLGLTGLTLTFLWLTSTDLLSDPQSIPDRFYWARFLVAIHMIYSHGLLLQIIYEKYKM